MKIQEPFITPVLLIIFNRPDTTARVFDEIRKAKPTKLYVAADGPRDIAGDHEKCKATRAVVEKVDWDCDVKHLFSEENLGCGLGVSTALNWFFENESEGVIFEDDTVPNQDFFWFCQELLKRYRNDERIMLIGGNNFQNGFMRGDGSYYFSKYPMMWGWAGWRRAWKLYDFKMTVFPKFKKEDQIKNIFEDSAVQEYWIKILDLTYKGKIDTWDYQWLFAIWVQNGLCITPNVNLVSNIGYGNKDSTHTKDPDDHLANVKTFPIENMTHPTFIMQDKDADENDSKNVFSIKKQNEPVAAEYGFIGDFFSWEEAKQQCAGYDSEVIFEKVKNAALKVKNGEAVYERDSVLFDKIQYSWPLLSGLLWIASLNDNRLNLIDFGGALGTSYYQNREFLKHLKELTWNIVEQEHFVKCGKELFEDYHLKFYFRIEDCLKGDDIPNTVLLSGVLQNIEKPYELLMKIADLNFQYLLIDRTPFSADSTECLKIQEVPPDIYEGSYPHWFFDINKFRSFLSGSYQVIEEFDSLIDWSNYPSSYKGFILKRIDDSSRRHVRKLNFADLITEESPLGLRIDGLGPIEGPYQQWDLPRVRWAKKNKTIIGFYNFDEKELKSILISMSFRPQARSSAKMTVKCNSLEIKKYDVIGWDKWRDDDLTFVPHKGHNLIEFLLDDIDGMTSPKDSLYMLFRKLSLSVNERYNEKLLEAETKHENEPHFCIEKDGEKRRQTTSATVVVSVIICTYNRASLLKIALESLGKQTINQSFYEVIVVNNKCTDDTVEVVNEYIGRYTNCRMIYEVNQGLSHARNRGYKEAKGRYIAYLDDDAKTPLNWVEEMIHFIERRPDADVFGGPYYEYSFKDIPTWLPPNIGTHTLGDVEHVLTPDEWIHGGNIVFSKPILEKYRGFNVNLGMKGKTIGYGEETELLMRIRNDKINVYYVPTMHIEHLISSAKYSLIWHLKSYYADGKYSMVVFNLQTSITQLINSILKSIINIPAIFFKEKNIPTKRRLFFSLRQIFYDIGNISGLLMKNKIGRII